MGLFSQRHGYTEVRTAIQREGLDRETRLDIWNVLARVSEACRDFFAYRPQVSLIEDRLWIGFFREARDEMPNSGDLWARVKYSTLKDDWYRVFDLIEVLVASARSHAAGELAGVFASAVRALNAVFEQNLVAYRIIAGRLTPLDSAEDVEAISTAIDNTEGLPGARHSIDRALSLLADRAAPDYPNSIKESISAVESVVKTVTGEGQLGAGLKRLEQAGLKIHPALRDAWGKMYGWASDEDGIRHAGIEPADADQALAKYTLVTCSAFVSLLIEEGRKQGVLPA